MKKLLFLVNVDWFFISHRLAIAMAAQKEGYEIHIATGITNRKKDLESYGFIVHPLPLSRGKAHPLNEAKAFLSIVRIVKKLKPSVVHLVTIKPVLYGSFAARLAGVNSVVAISGLGYIFTAKGFSASLKRKLIEIVYRLALEKRKNQKVIFQNDDDYTILTNIAKDLKTVVIPGSGIDLDEFSFKPEPTTTPTVIMAARLLADKGVHEFMQAAKTLHDKGVKAKFQLVGDPDPDNPTSITPEQLDGWRKDNIVEILGRRNDIASLFSKANLVVLPSYREGFPKVLIEAAACGRAVVTTDVAGCRDAILPNQTGLLVPARDSGALAKAMELLINDDKRRSKMGKAARQLAEAKYDVKQVVQTHLDIYQQLIEEEEK